MKTKSHTNRKQVPPPSAGPLTIQTVAMGKLLRESKNSKNFVDDGNERELNERE